MMMMIYHLSDGDVRKKLNSIVSPFFLVLNHDFMTPINFSHITASNTVTDDATN